MKTKKKLLSFLLTCGLVLGMMPTTAFAANAANTADTWEDYAATDFAGGSGTKDDPYQIATAEQLAKLASEVNSHVVGKTHDHEYFKLTASIDLSAHRWIPIGYGNSTNASSFTGYFDGNNQTITGLNVDERGNNTDAGLFGAVAVTTNEPVLKNFTIENATIYAGNETDDSTLQYGAGVLVGSITLLGGSSATYAAIENCHVSGQVDSKMYAGGLIGAASYGNISSCSANTIVTGHAASGGFTGYSFSSSFTNNTAKGSITSTGWSTGGFAGWSHSTTYENDTTETNVISTGWSTGGFVGYAEENTVTKCTASGNVQADNWNLGGFAGYLSGATTVDTCAAYGDVTGTATDFIAKAGGFVGTNQNSKIQNSHATGMVTGSNQYGAAGGFVASDENGTTTGCSFDQTKNPLLTSVGNTVTQGTNDITPKTTDEVLADICNDYFGGHAYQTA